MSFYDISLMPYCVFNASNQVLNCSDGRSTRGPIARPTGHVHKRGFFHNNWNYLVAPNETIINALVKVGPNLIMNAAECCEISASQKIGGNIYIVNLRPIDLMLVFTADVAT